MKFRLKTVVDLRAVFWPDFVEFDHLILLPWEITSWTKHNRGKFDNLTQAEAFQNHTHMIDLLKYDPAIEHVDEDGQLVLDREHPDYKQICEIGKALASMWLQKLHFDFPDYRFRVYYTEDPDPVVRFHRVRTDETVWLDETKVPEEIRTGTIIVYDSTTV